LTNASIEMPLLEIPLERTSFRSVLIRSKARRFTPDPSGARVHDVSIPRFPRIWYARRVARLLIVSDCRFAGGRQNEPNNEIFISMPLSLRAWLRDVPSGTIRY
jgi:hypothetical protein